MKTTKLSASKPARKRKTALRAAAKVSPKRTRPLHKRLLLHPFTVMVILCVGVILAGSTYQGIAASYEVTASVDAPPAVGPAIITAPYDTQHLSAPQATIVGSCPAATYVKLYRSGNFSGTASCSAGIFQIQTSLSPGPNQLQARVYNLTNHEGPVSPSITVHYDDTTVDPPLPPPVTPSEMRVVAVEDIGYRAGTIQQTSDRPTVSGYAIPFADIVVTFHSDVMYCRTKADAVGWWTCTLDRPLPEGVHHVDVTASNEQGWSAVLPTFEIRVRSGMPNMLKPLLSSGELQIAADYTFQTHYVGQPFTWSIGMIGGKAPYVVHVEWGDDSHSVFERETGRDFTLTHAYPAAKTYTVFVKATDTSGKTVLMQLTAVVKGQAAGVASITNSGPFVSLFSTVRNYLWIVWPVYAAVVLMAISYWLGEQDVYQRLRGRTIHTGRKR